MSRENFRERLRESVPGLIAHGFRLRFLEIDTNLMLPFVAHDHFLPGSIVGPKTE